MNNAATIIRSLIIYGLCLPLAVYLGYILAMPMDRTSFAVVVVVLALPLIPILMRWHHLLLILSWNMSMVLFFVQGSPYLWMAMTATSMFLTILQHVLKRNVQFASVPAVTIPLVFLAFVIVITAQLTGGIGLRAFGGDSMGGRRYIQLFCAIVGYFAITSHRIVEGKAPLYVALYFLGTLTTIMGSIAPWMPSGLHMIYALFPVENLDSLQRGVSAENLRLGGVSLAAMAVIYWILARHSFKGLTLTSERWRFLPLQYRGGFGINQPWRLLVLFAMIWITLQGGYRSNFIILALIFVTLFFLEGLHRTKYAPTLILSGILILAVTLPFADKLPLFVQRSLSILPLELDPRIRENAQASTEWRLRIWEQVIPTIPRYLIIGKGYGIDPRELQAVQAASEFQSSSDGTDAELAQDYHSGPLSLIIPLGIFGTIGFLWFLGAGFRLLIRNYRYGSPGLRGINTFLLAYFITRTLFFFAVYGSFQNELAVFTGIVALSAAINGGMRKPVLAPAKPNPAYQPFRLPKVARA
jgi:hypothetical protein